MVRIGVILGKYDSEERQRRKSLIESYSTFDTVVEALEVSEDPYSTNLTGGAVAMITPSYLEVAQQAEMAGYDAVVPFGTLDIGVEAGRTFLKIPIVGPLEAGLRLATFLGDKIGMITYTGHAAPYQLALARLYGLEERVVGLRSLGISLNRLVDSQDALRKGFVDAAADLRRAGAHVIIPAGVSMCPVWMSPGSLAEEIGLPVVECVGAPIRIASLLARGALSVSEARYPAA